MKKIFFYIFLIFFLAAFSCIKNKLVTWNGALAEIDLTVWNANGPGVTYPFVTRVPAANRVLTTGCPDSTLRRYSGNIKVRINLVGGHSSKDETVGYEIFTKPVDSIPFPATLGFTCTVPPPASSCRQLPMTNAAPTITLPTPPGSCISDPRQLPVLDATAGVHYAALSGTVTIPKDSSFGYINIQILNPGTSNFVARFLGIRLNSNGSLKPSQNYKEVGLFIDQR